MTWKWFISYANNRQVFYDYLSKNITYIDVHQHYLFIWMVSFEIKFNKI